MNKNRKLSLALAGLVFAASPALAQTYPTPTPPTPTPTPTQPTNPQQGHESQDEQRRQHEILFRDIQLSSEQRQQIDSIFAKAREEQRSLQTSAAWDTDTINSRRQMKELKEKMLDDVRPILTAEQQPVYARNRQTLAAQMPKRDPSRR
jgi:Spy/CpxP family protein refolding chaperone